MEGTRTFLEILSSFGVNIFLCLIGLMGYTLWVVRKHIYDFKASRFWGENKPFWIWAGLVQFLYVLLTTSYPSIEIWLSGKIISVFEAVLAMPLDVPEDLVNTIVYLTLSYQLSRYVNKGVNGDNKIGSKKV